MDQVALAGSARRVKVTLAGVGAAGAGVDAVGAGVDATAAGALLCVERCDGRSA